jgi:hypothetical protein
MKKALVLMALLLAASLGYQRVVVLEEAYQEG